MKLSTKLGCAILGLCAAVMTPGGARAEDDNGPDGKGYPGNMCTPVLSTTTFSHNNNAYVNTSGTSVNVVCPAIQDSWMSTSGLGYSRMQVNNVNGGTITCLQVAFNINGTSVSSASASTTTAGLSTLYFLTGGTYLPTTAAEGYFSTICALGAGDSIRSYTIQERL